MLMMMCNFIHSMLSKDQICKHHEMLTMNKFEIIKTNSSIIMLQMLDSVIKIITILHLNNANIRNNV